MVDSLLSKLAVTMIPASILDETERHLRRYGQKNKEALIFWSGTKTQGENRVRRCICPTQSCSFVSAEVLLDKLQKISIILWENHEVLIAQVHSHPGEAFLSFIDAQYPITFQVGFFSIVVPNFARAGLELSSCSIFVHRGYGQWSQLGPKQVWAKFVVVNSALR